jgi:hypothetical protein
MLTLNFFTKKCESNWIILKNIGAKFLAGFVELGSMGTENTGGIQVDNALIGLFLSVESWLNLVYYRTFDKLKKSGKDVYRASCGKQRACMEKAEFDDNLKKACFLMTQKGRKALPLITGIREKCLSDQRNQKKRVSYHPLF